MNDTFGGIVIPVKPVQDWNTLLFIVVTEFGMVIPGKLVQLRNILDESALRVFERLTLVKLVQDWNTLLPILVTLVIDILVKLTHLKKALLEMLVHTFGMFILLNLQSKNAVSLILTTPFGIVALPILVTPPEIVIVDNAEQLLNIFV